MHILEIRQKQSKDTQAGVRCCRRKREKTAAEFRFVFSKSGLRWISRQETDKIPACFLDRNIYYHITRGECFERKTQRL